jgi:hypothetical protein
MSKSLPPPGLRQAGKCQMNAKWKKTMEEWNDGTLEDRVENKVFSLLRIILSSQHSSLPE